MSTIDQNLKRNTIFCYNCLMSVKYFDRIIELKAASSRKNRIAAEKLKIAEDCFNNQKGICPGCGKPIIFDYAFFRWRWFNKKKYVILICEDCGIKTDNRIQTQYFISKSWERSYKFKGSEFAYKEKISEKAKKFIDKSLNIFTNKQNNKCWYCQKEIPFENTYFIKPYGTNENRFVCQKCNKTFHEWKFSKDYSLLLLYRQKEHKNEIEQFVWEGYQPLVFRMVFSMTTKLEKFNLKFDKEYKNDFLTDLRYQYLPQALQFSVNHLKQHNPKTFCLYRNLNAYYRHGFEKFLKDKIKTVVAPLTKKEMQFNKKNPDRKIKAKSIIGLKKNFGDKEIELKDTRNKSPEQLAIENDLKEHWEKSLDRMSKIFTKNSQKVAFDFIRRNFDLSTREIERKLQEMGIKRSKSTIANLKKEIKKREIKFIEDYNS